MTIPIGLNRCDVTVSRPRHSKRTHSGQNNGSDAPPCGTVFAQVCPVGTYIDIGLSVRVAARGCTILPVGEITVIGSVNGFQTLMHRWSISILLFQFFRVPASWP